MAEIRVEPKNNDKKSVPWWLLVLGALGLLALLFLLFGRDRGGATEARKDGVDTSPSAAAAHVTNARLCTADGACGPKELCLGGTCSEISKDTPACATASVRFRTDSAELEADQAKSLDRLARCLNADREMKLSIEGGADQRGTAPHNDELGEKRARAVARELGARGASSSQLHVVTYGENRPLCAENDEACWSKNRRADVKVLK